MKTKIAKFAGLTKINGQTVRNAENSSAYHAPDLVDMTKMVHFIAARVSVVWTMTMTRIRTIVEGPRHFLLLIVAKTGRFRNCYSHVEHVEKIIVKFAGQTAARGRNVGVATHVSA